jgi:hypothetical protein
MTTIAKVLIPNKSWLLENDGEKFATLSRDKKGYSILCRGQEVKVHDLKEIKERFGITISEEALKKEKEKQTKSLPSEIYGFPVNGRAYGPLWNVQQKLPIYAKSSKSKSLYCAGYYIVKFRKGWVKGFCPKLITLERNPFQGPFKTKEESLIALREVNKKI